MTPRRQRRLEDMQIRHLAASTQRAYVEHVARFAWWRVSRSRPWLFPGHRPGQPITTRAVNRACRTAQRRCGRKEVAVPSPVGCTIHRATIAQDNGGVFSLGDRLQLALYVVNRTLCRLTQQWGIAARERPPKTMPAASGSVLTCMQKKSRLSFRTAVLPAPGPPVRTPRRGTWLSRQSHGFICSILRCALSAGQDTLRIRIPATD
jgi:hypothetical protein